QLAFGLAVIPLLVVHVVGTRFAWQLLDREVNYPRIVAAIWADPWAIAKQVLESERGMAELEGIAATPGIDVLWLGHFDLTNFLGIPGEFESPKYLDAVRAVVTAARRHGKGLGFMAADAVWARRYRELGFNMIAAGLDSSLLQSAIRATLRGLR